MDINEADIKQIVERVIEKVAQQQKPEIKQSASDCENEYGLFGTVEEAVKSAQKAFLELRCLPLEKRDKIIAGMREISRNNIESLAEDMEKETGLGRAEDKKLKLKLAIEKTPGTEDIKSVVYSGDNGLTLIERAPYGVIGSITPVTNPVETIINNSIGFVASGNSAVFNAHPGSKRVSTKIIGLLNKAIITAGGPANLLCGIIEPEIESAKELMQNDSIRLLVVTGGEGVVKEAMKSGKKVIAAGPGNPPVVVDETADICKAAEFIMEGASTDNNVICVQEKEIIVVDAVADELKKELVNNNGYEIKGYNIQKLEKLVVEGNGPNKKYVGKNASVILKEIGINVSEDIRLIIAEVDELHPFVQNEMLMPVIGLVRVGNVDEAIDMAVRCEHGFRHTAVMHSKNIDNLSKMAKVMDTSIFVKNASSLTGLGHNGEGHTSYTIAGFTGEGLTSAKSFTRERKCVLKDHFRII